MFVRCSVIRTPYSAAQSLVDALPRLYMQVSQPGTERKACIKVFSCCQGYAI